MDSPTPPREDEPRRCRDGNEPSRTNGVSSFPLFAVLVAIFVVLLAVLINFIATGWPQKPAPSDGSIGRPILHRHYGLERRRVDSQLCLENKVEGRYAGLS